MRSITEKKSDVNLALMGVTILLMASFLFVMGLIMLDEMYTDTVSTDSATTTRETATSITNDTDQTAANAGLCGFHEFSIINMTNASNESQVVLSGNYTITSSRIGTYRLTTAGGAGAFNGTNVNISYTYEYGNSEACLATNETIIGQGKFGDYIDLIVIAIVITLIIALVLGAMAGYRKTR